MDCNVYHFPDQRFHVLPQTRCAVGREGEAGRRAGYVDVQALDRVRGAGEDVLHQDGHRLRLAAVDCDAESAVVAVCVVERYEETGGEFGICHVVHRKSLVMDEIVDLPAVHDGVLHV